MTHFDAEVFYKQLEAAPDFEVRLRLFVSLPDREAWERLCEYGRTVGGRRWRLLRLQVGLAGQWTEGDIFPGEQYLKGRLGRQDLDADREG
jgi:hypothetical protein